MDNPFNVIVCDPGSSAIRLGYAGNDAPDIVYPSSIGVQEGTNKSANTNSSSKSKSNSNISNHNNNKYYTGDEDLYVRRDNMSLTPSMNLGQVVDWNAFERVIDYGLNTKMAVEMKQHPILMTESPSISNSDREKMTEMIFESFSAPSLFFSKTAVLSCYANGKTTGVVVDCGASCTQSTVVHDGYVLDNVSFKAPLGGSVIDQQILKLVESKTKSELSPQYTISKKKGREGKLVIRKYPDTHDSYKQYMKLDIARDIKETIFELFESRFDPEVNVSVPCAQYKLPDGTEIELSTERFTITELLMDPVPLNRTDCQISIPQLIQQSISSCATEMRRDMFPNIIIVGGGSLFDGFVERIQKETVQFAPATQRVRVLSAGSERKWSSWIGGSILGSLTTFEELCMSKSDYEEHGAGLVHRQCP
jgi:actin-like protein 6A